jgi:hypothetical protein
MRRRWRIEEAVHPDRSRGCARNPGAFAGRLLQLLISSQQRLARVEERWRQTHMLIQAAEYYLLQKGTDPEAPPLDVFPYKEYSSTCTFRDAENLPETYNNLNGQLPLQACTIELVRGRDGKTVDSVTVDRFNYEADTTSETTTNN